MPSLARLKTEGPKEEPPSKPFVPNAMEIAMVEVVPISRKEAKTTTASLKGR